MQFEDYPLYQGTDLGLTYSKEKSALKVWSPNVNAMTVHIYNDGHTESKIESKTMSINSDGVWLVTLQGDMRNKYYTFQVKHDNSWLNEVPDPCAKAVGLNGHRAMFVDLSATNPNGWEHDIRPSLTNFTDIILYELHVRDISSHSSSGISKRGKFLGLVEEGTKNDAGQSTGLDHFKELGITHVHLLPAFDFRSRSVDEANTADQFNWGYDPQNYNVPEGSYSTNPFDGNVRIKEFKEMVFRFHQNGIRVILDVVYNHTGENEGSNFNQIVPGYYYRFNEDGSYSNASGCGNETASERFMVRKFILESMKYWVEEYHLDGFRVDLMGIHDIETMNQIADEIHKIDPTIFIYGEGWTAGDSPLPVEQRSLKAHALKLNNIAVFSDDIRDALKGSVFDHKDRGFVSGKKGMEPSIQFGIVAATQHPQVDYKKVNYSKAPYAKQPSQCVNYVSCHDNHTLYDKLLISTTGDSDKKIDENELLKMHRLANTIVLTSQGVPFLHAGVELVRTKKGVENSFESPDSINQIDWTRKTIYKEHFNYYKQLIHLRKNHPAFRIPSSEIIQKHLTFLETGHELVVAYLISDNANGDTWKEILVVFNGSEEAQMIDLPDGQWTVVLEENRIDENGIRNTNLKTEPIAPKSSKILKQKF